MRPSLKTAVERLLLLGPARIARLGRRSRSLILAFHNVVPACEAPAGERSLHVPRGRFEDYLDVVERRADVVPLQALLGEASQADRPRVAITFDDAYRGAVTAGVEELASRGLPATLFAAPGRLGGRAFWWDLLADAESGAVPPAVRQEALGSHAGRQEVVLAWAQTTGLRAFRELPPHARSATEAELTRAAETPGIRIASHTWSHPNMARLTEAECGEEIRRSAGWLSARFPEFVPFVSYPYGAHSEGARGAVREAGCKGGLLISGGWIPRGGGDPYLVPRLNVPAGLSPEGLDLRLSGFLVR